MESIIKDLGSAKSASPARQLKFFRKTRLLKILAVFLGVVLLFCAVAVFLIILPGIKLKDKAFKLKDDSQKISSSFQSQNLGATLEAISQTKTDLIDFQSDYKHFAWTGVIPYLGEYYKDGERLISAGLYLVEGGTLAVESIQPYADILGFETNDPNAQPKVTTAEQRLEIALDTLDKIQPNLETINGHISQAKSELDQINPNRYPEEVKGYKVKENIISVQNTLDGISEIVGEAGPLIGQLKPILGLPDEKKYLVLFQNDAELRPTGGFITAYAIIAVQNGNFKPLGSYDIYGIDDKFGNKIKAPQPILDYHKNVFYWHLRDMNLSPDYKTSMDIFWENFKKVGPSDVDGIISVDTKVLVNILEVLGPIGVGGWGNFSAENDPRCDCPQVFYVLEQYADRPVGTIREERKAVLGPLMQSILMNVMQSSKKKWPEFFNVLLDNVKQKHVLAYFFDENIQKSMEAINASGTIKDYDGDYLHVNDSNFAGAKSNMFIKESFEQQIEVAGDGTIQKTLTVSYKNPAPASNCNLEAGELCLNGLYRDWVRVYVPKGSKLISVEGSEIEAKTYEDLGKTVFEAFYGDKAPLRPQGSAKLVFKYSLPFKMDNSKPYRMLIQKQPGTYGYENTITLGSKQKNFNLDTDLEISL